MQRPRLKATVMMLLAELCENLMPAETGEGHYSAPVEAALHFLHNRYRGHGLNLGDVAGAAHLSEAHFGRIFRAELGIPPMKYLNRLRIARAGDLLQRTRLSVTETGAAVGFASASPKRSPANSRPAHPAEHFTGKHLQN